MLLKKGIGYNYTHHLYELCYFDKNQVLFSIISKNNYKRDSFIQTYGINDMKHGYQIDYDNGSLLIWYWFKNFEQGLSKENNLYDSYALNKVMDMN